MRAKEKKTKKQEWPNIITIIIAKIDKVVTAVSAIKAAPHNNKCQEKTGTEVIITVTIKRAKVVIITLVESISVIKAVILTPVVG